jgi:hypothetical protein
VKVESFAMADDNMEIFSDHGETVGDDIDIDIDFTGGQVDEDYILQDAQPSADYGAEFPPQQSPMHHDDPMIADDSASYQMEDADLVHNEAVQDAEPEPMSFASSDIPFSGGDIANAVDAIIYSEDHNIGLFEQDDDYEFEGTEGGFVLVAENDSEGNVGSNAENVPAHVEYIADKVVDEGQEVKKHDSEPESHESTSPHRGSQATQEEPREPRSPPASISIPAHSSPVYESNDLVRDPGQNPCEASVDTEEPDPSELAPDFSKARDMKVVYQSVEYALFSSSESDDPDSFFLSDLTVMEKPLDQFFQAIREIIRDDLTAEDELCLNVEDLGLETEEVSGPTSLRKISC